MDFKKWILALDGYVSWGTPKRVLMLTFVAIICIVSLTFFEHRVVISDLIFKGKDASPQEVTITLTPDVKQKIQDLAAKSQDINFVMVISVNIRVNQREMVYYSSSDPLVDRNIKMFTATRSKTQPVFSSDEKNNLEMVAAINGEFGCFKYEDTPTTFSPKLNGLTSAVCRVSLPPYYGEFSGYVTIGLTHWPDEALQNEIRIEAVRIATEIYFKSIKTHD